MAAGATEGHTRPNVLASRATPARDLKPNAVSPMINLVRTYGRCHRTGQPQVENQRIGSALIRVWEHVELEHSVVLKGFSNQLGSLFNIVHYAMSSVTSTSASMSVMMVLVLVLSSLVWSEHTTASGMNPGPPILAGPGFSTRMLGM